MFRPRAFRPLVLVLATAVATATACGGGGGEAAKSAAQILADAKTAAAAATSVHVTGTVTTQGQDVPVDLRMGPSGAVGTSAFSGTRVQLVRAGSSLYVRGAQKVFGDFLGAAIARRIDDHWVQISTSMPQLEQLAVVTDKARLLAQVLTTSRAPTKAGTTTVDGHKVVTLRGFGPDGNATLLVATSGTPYPVRLVAGGRTLTFTDWNQPVSVHVPADTVSLASLLGG